MSPTGARLAGEDIGRDFVDADGKPIQSGAGDDKLEVVEVQAYLRELLARVLPDSMNRM